MAACDYCELVESCDDGIMNSPLAACQYDSIEEYNDFQRRRNIRWSTEDKAICSEQWAHCAKMVPDCDEPCEMVIEAKYECW